MAREIILSQDRWVEKDYNSWDTLAGGLNAAMNSGQMFIVSLNFVVQFFGYIFMHLII